MKSVINTNRVEPDPSPRFFLQISVSDINDSRDKFQLKDLQAVNISYTKDASAEKVLEKHIRLRLLLEIYKTICKCICKLYY